MHVVASEERDVVYGRMSEMSECQASDAEVAAISAGVGDVHMCENEALSALAAKSSSVSISLPPPSGESQASGVRMGRGTVPPHRWMRESKGVIVEAAVRDSEREPDDKGEEEPVEWMDEDEDEVVAVMESRGEDPEDGAPWARTWGGASGPTLHQRLLGVE